MRALLLVVVVLTGACGQRVQQDAPPLKIEAKKPLFLRDLETEELNPYAAVFDVERQPDVVLEKIGKVAAFSFVGRNFNPDQTFILASEHMNGTFKKLYEYKVDDDGTLGRQVHDGTMMMENDVILMFDFYRAQPVRYWLYSTDGTVRLSRLIIPYPIEAVAKDGAKISLRRITPDAKLMLCEGHDFKPDEIVLISSQTGKDLISDIPISCSNGRFSVALEPGLSGKTGGYAYVQVRRSNERLLLEYPWGCEATHLKSQIASSRHVDPQQLQKLSLESAKKAN